MQAQTVQRADARRNRGLILEAAKAAFARDGIDASLDEVARSAGVGPGTLYRHFPTREHLLCELLHERQTVLLSNRDKAAALSCAKTALLTWMAELKDYLSAFNGLPRSFVKAMEAQTSPLAVTCQTLISITEEFLSRAQADGAARPSVAPQALFFSVLGAAFVHDKVREYGAAPESVDEILAYGYLADDSTKNAHESIEHSATERSATRHLAIKHSAIGSNPK